MVAADPAVASTDAGWDDLAWVVVVVEVCGDFAWRPWPLWPRWPDLVVVPVVDPAAVVVVDRPAAMTADDATVVGVEVGTVRSEDAASLPAEWSAAGEADVEEGMAAGTATAMTATAATVPPNMTLERPSGIGAEPMSHWPHPFMACSQLFIPEPLRTCVAPPGDGGESRP
jgi:hypothetical protein